MCAPFQPPRFFEIIIFFEFRILICHSRKRSSKTKWQTDMEQDETEVVVVGSEATPTVGMRVRDLHGGVREGTIIKVVERVSAQSQTSSTLSCGVVWEEGGSMQVGGSSVAVLTALLGPASARHHMLHSTVQLTLFPDWPTGASAQEDRARRNIRSRPQPVGSPASRTWRWQCQFLR